ncbi:DUF1214 domain-containing protein [Mechercharimyces sp. CAU 1602]|uniref:DUF1214 domain-containing protein n=1 Tax=Mechercharimyces sp. CAU 1602 TaxID=2973933 RepID=UPI002163DCF0|nr:DUF1214 domain-containing protein [Mechercharimyces sp. CAU 1602]MCS1352586.1 DUF1214 domain-containing protein [Mechercharimyces sp. CAU 1602]
MLERSDICKGNLPFPHTKTTPIDILPTQLGIKDFESAQFTLSYALGIQAYIYGYSLVLHEQKKRLHIANLSPINTLFYSDRLVSPSYNPFASGENIRPNADTLYATGYLDLSLTAVYLTVPADPSGKRYYSVQLFDAYNNVAYNISNRTTASTAGTFIIVGPDQHQQSYHNGMNIIMAPTNSIFVVIKVEVEGKQDLFTAIQFEKNIRITPVKAVPPPPPKPLIPSTIFSSPRFYFLMSELMRENPPPRRDTPVVEQYKLIGINCATGFRESELTLATKRGLEKAVINDNAQSIVSAGTAYYTRLTSRPWITIFPLGHYGDQYLLRASIAKNVALANIPQEEFYQVLFIDSNQRSLLYGSNHYQLHFSPEQIPQSFINFWTIDMYTSDGKFVPNPIERYSIGSNTETLQYNADGSLDIIISPYVPPQQRSNWLPSPQGQVFNLVLRTFNATPSYIQNPRTPGVELIAQLGGDRQI